MSVSPARGRILAALKTAPGTVADVRERGVATGKRATYQLLRAMEDEGLVRRTDERVDGSHVWQLTREGRALMPEVPAEPHTSHGPHEAESHPLEDAEAPS